MNCIEVVFSELSVRCSKWNETETQYNWGTYVNVDRTKLRCGSLDTSDIAH